MGMLGQSAVRRSAVIALAMVLAAAALAALAAVTRASVAGGFLHVRTNLSSSPDLMSAFPDLAVSPDGEWVAVTWVEGYDSSAGYKGDVYLRAASESSGWGPRILVFDGDSSTYAYYRASVAVTGTVAHVTYVVFEHAAGVLYATRLYYRTCSLVTRTCGASEQITSTLVSSGNQITWSDLALDANGKPHVVWDRYYISGTVDIGRVFYAARPDDGWTIAAVDSTGDADRPVVAWADGYAHVAWKKTWQSGGAPHYGIYYRRRDTSPGGMWGVAVPLFDTVNADYEPQYPSVAAGNGRVFVVWDACYSVFGGKCEGYVVLYRRSNTGGMSFPSYPSFQEVGTDDLSWDALEPYDPTGEELAEFLQPFIVLNDNGWPAVAWHAGYDGSTALYYSHAVTGTDSGVAWITPTVLIAGGVSVPRVGVIEAGADGEQHLHFAYMRSGSNWDVYYDSDESGAYHMVYLPLVSRSYP